jgi:hypothetical protein
MDSAPRWLRVEADGLLVKIGDRWWFTADFPDLLLLAAATIPVNASLAQGLEPLFGTDDPWRMRPVKDLATGLAARAPRKSPFAETTRDITSIQSHSPLQVGQSADASGRGLLADSSCASPGELLLHERAHAVALWPAAFRSHCHHCLRPLKLSELIPCGHFACDDIYCSAACQAEAWRSGHCVECGTPWYRIAPRTVVLCARALLVDPACDGSKGTRASSSSLSSVDHPSHGGLAGLLRLHDHKDAMSDARLSLLRFHAFVAFHALRPSFELRGRSEEELSLLLRLALTNVFAISGTCPTHPNGHDTSFDDKSGGAVESVEHVTVGEAFFTRASLLNHSCTPNSTLRLDGRTLELRSSTPLAAQDEVFTCYGPQAGFVPVAARRKVLRRLYYFECSCSACRRETSSSAIPPEQRRARASRLDELARAACQRGDFEEAASLCADAIRQLRCVFPPGSTMLAHEEAKLGRLKFNARPDAAAAIALKRAAAALEMCYGPECEEIAELRQLEAMCTL